MLKKNKNYNMDCLEGMKLLDDNCIDLVVTSPPYDELRKYNGYSFDFEDIVSELYRVMKPGGIIVWIVGDQTKNGSETGTSFRQALGFIGRGFKPHDTMIYEKNTSSFPARRNGNRYTQIFEYMFVFSKGKPKAMNFICDHKTTAGGRIQKKDACINKGKQKDGAGTFVRNEYSRRTNIWRITIGKNKETQGHPAPFPEQLAKDHIITWSNEGDIVLDPFSGSGTTHKMALLNNRRFIGFEISQEYIDIETQRLKDCGLWRYDY